MSSRGSKLAQQMRERVPDRPPAEQCPGCDEWSNLPHPHRKTDEPPLREVRR